MSVWLWVGVAFVAGGLVGAGITALLKRGSDVQQRMQRLRREYEQYQAEVARHFSQTGELLSRLRTTVDQLYGEVQERATSLVAEEAVQRRLGYLDNGQRGAGGADTGTAPRLGDDRAASPGFGGTPAGSAAATDRRPSTGAPTPPEEADSTHQDGDQDAGAPAEDRRR